jgi:hypothetical protein
LKQGESWNFGLELHTEIQVHLKMVYREGNAGVQYGLAWLG